MLATPCLPARILVGHTANGKFYRCSSAGNVGTPCGATIVRADDTVKASGMPRNTKGRILPLDDEKRARFATIPGVESRVWAMG